MTGGEIEFPHRSLGQMYLNRSPTDSKETLSAFGGTQGISPTVSNASSPNNATQQNQAALKLRDLHNVEKGSPDTPGTPGWSLLPLWGNSPPGRSLRAVREFVLGPSGGRSLQAGREAGDVLLGKMYLNWPVLAFLWCYVNHVILVPVGMLGNSIERDVLEIVGLMPRSRPKIGYGRFSGSRKWCGKSGQPLCPVCALGTSPQGELPRRGKRGWPGPYTGEALAVGKVGG